MHITCVTIDCADPVSLATFWNAALGWTGATRVDDESGAVCLPGDGTAYLEFVRVPEGKVVKNRLHLGCSAGELGALDDEIARLTDLGATFAWEEAFAPEIAVRYRNVVMRDPEGNEFCLGAGSYAG